MFYIFSIYFYIFPYILYVFCIFLYIYICICMCVHIYIFYSARSESLKTQHSNANEFGSARAGKGDVPTGRLISDQ